MTSRTAQYPKPASTGWSSGQLWVSIGRPVLPNSSRTAATSTLNPVPGGPLVAENGQPLPPLADDEIVLTSWAAVDQMAKVGDRIRITYFEPETTHGNEREASAEFRVAAIVPLTEPTSMSSASR